MFDDDVRRCLLEYEQRSGAMLNWVAFDTRVPVLNPSSHAPCKVRVRVHGARCTARGSHPDPCTLALTLTLTRSCSPPSPASAPRSCTR